MPTSALACLACAMPLRLGTKKGERESPEHPVLKSLGGRLSSRSLLCTPCNNMLGTKIDAPLAKALAPMRYTLALRSGDGDPPPVLRALDSELGPIDLGLGSMRRSRSTPIEIRPHETGFDFKTNARTVAEAAFQTAHAARRAGIRTTADLLARLKLPEHMVLKKTPLSKPLTFHMPIGDPEHFRSIAKTAMEVFAMLYPDESRGPECDGIRGYVARGQGPEGRARWSFDSALFLRPPPMFGAVPHSVVVWAHPGRPIVAHVCLFGWLWFVVRIADESPIRDSFCGLHVVDPLGEQSIGIRRLSVVPPAVLLDLFDEKVIPQDLVDAQFFAFVKAAKEAGLPRHMTALVEADLADRGERWEELSSERRQAVIDEVLARELRGPRIERTEPIDPDTFRRLVVQQFEELSAKD